MKATSYNNKNGNLMRPLRVRDVTYALEVVKKDVSPHIWLLQLYKRLTAL